MVTWKNSAVNLLKIISILAIALSCAKKKIVKYEKIKNVAPERLEKTQYEEIRGNESEEVIPEHMQSGFLISIEHLNDKAINGKYRVNWNGDLYLPYKVKINVLKKTFTQVTNEIQSRYLKFFSNDSPKVEVRLLQRKYYINVTGLVRKPGKILVRYNETMDEILGKVEGILPEQKNEFTSILVQTKDDRKIEIPYLEYVETGNPKLFPYWQGNEEIFIRKIGSRDQEQRQIILVTGEVRAPKEVPFERDGDIYYYLTKAGGFTNTANLRKIEIQRGKGKSLKVIPFDLHKVETVPVIYPGDKLIVHTEKPEFWEKVLDKVVDFSTILTAIAFIIIAL